MSILTATEYAARAAAAERCALHLERRGSIDASEATADGWLACKLRVEADAWKVLAGAAVTVRGMPSDTSPNKVGRPITSRMADSLVEMTRGTRVESEAFFSWPRWKYEPGVRKMTSLGCPTRAMLEGLYQRGLLSVSKESRRWFSSITDEGRRALAAHEQAKKDAKPTQYKRFSISYSITQLGQTRSNHGPVVARTQEEAVRKLSRDLKRRNATYEYTDFTVDWVSDHG